MLLELGARVKVTSLVVCKALRSQITTMCGIAGCMLDKADFHGVNIVVGARTMGRALSHRGPDAGGDWNDQSAGFAISHRRLSIIDLSPTGAQPMHSHSGRYVIVFNGEIYNFKILRQALEQRGVVFNGHSDTEVLVEGFAAWGVRATLERANGMFALALWDRQERHLYLARDRLGEKPLYYGWYDGVLLFASELKALHAWPGFRPALNRDALALFMRSGYVPDPHCIFQGIRKLLPGHFIRLSADATQDTREEAYWSLEEAVVRGAKTPVTDSSAAAVEHLDRQLREAVALRMVADVPLGAFLSGGIDSSTIVALMQAQSMQPIRTFSIGFDLPEFDESVHARAIAKHLGTAHTELVITSSEARAVIPLLADIYDEPFADSSQIPTYLVSKLARTGVTVAMSGDAGDELFGGYSRYAIAVDLWRKMQRMPNFARLGLGAGIQALSPRRWDQVMSILRPLLPNRYRFRSPGDKLHKFARMLSAQEPGAMYKQLVSLWSDPAELVIDGREPLTALDLMNQAPPRELVERMMYADTLHYLPGDILVKVDRASMAVSLESRVPFLDHAVVEYAWRLPLELKVRDGQGKWILRQVLGRYVPRALFDRPKMGFGVPIGDWLRGPLREWAEALLSPARLRDAGYFEVAPIRAAWTAHLAGEQNLQYLIWNVLMFEQWRERWGY